jgi:predicted dehydrogenase
MNSGKVHLSMNEDANPHKLRVGIVGGADISAVGFAHKSALALLDGVEVTTGCFSRNSKVNRRSGEFWGLGSGGIKDSASRVFEDPNVDLCIILTPTPSHENHIDLAIAASMPFVSEKSLTTDASSTRRLMEDTKSKHLFARVIQNYTGFPMIREMAAIVRSPEFGVLRSARLRMLQDSYIRVPRSGVFSPPQAWRQEDFDIPTLYLDLGVHLIGVFEFVSGLTLRPLATLNGSHGRVPDIIDYTTSIGTAGQGATVSLTFGKTTPGRQNDMVIELESDDLALEWSLSNPDTIQIGQLDGSRQSIFRGLSDNKVASEIRYQRFKAGHPTGFVEGLANYYQDVFLEFLSSKGQKTLMELQGTPQRTFDLYDSSRHMDTLATMKSQSVQESPH